MDETKLLRPSLAVLMAGMCFGHAGFCWVTGNPPNPWAGPLYMATAGALWVAVHLKSTSNALLRDTAKTWERLYRAERERRQ